MSASASESTAAASTASATAAVVVDRQQVHIDKEQFNSTIRLLALRVPAKASSEYLKRFGDAHLFLRPKTKKIYAAPGEPTKRLVLLAQQHQDLALSTLPAPLREWNQQQGGAVEEFHFQVDYSQFSADEALRQLLPLLSEVPSSFEQAGHIAHLNLREEALPHKFVIGQVILDKAPSVRTVVNKVSSIASEYRTFPMELLAGDADYEVTLRESGATFRFNFCDVYWNSRLQMEHDRLIAIIRNKATAIAVSATNSNSSGSGSKALVVADMMVGVGPFAVPLAMRQNNSRSSNCNNNIATAATATVGKSSNNNNNNNNNNNSSNSKSKGSSNSSSNKKSESETAANAPAAAGREIIVHANDLNPASFKYLQINARANHCGRQLQAYNLDGREFILRLLNDGIEFEEVIMNLPQTATDFLDVFIGATARLADKYDEGHLWRRQLPVINVYAFSTHPTDPIADVIHRCAAVLHTTADVLRSSSCSSSGGSSNSDISNSNGSSNSDINSGSRSGGDAVGHIVRDVAPKKVMVCIRFTLPREVAEAKPLHFHFNSSSSSSNESNEAAAAAVTVTATVAGMKRSATAAAAEEERSGAVKKLNSHDD